MTRSPDHERVLSQNRKALHRFLVLESLECGIVLVGTEVKSLRSGGASIAEAFGRIENGELWLHGATIGEYSHGNTNNHAPQRPRKLLLSKREIAAWHRQVRERGVTLVPLRMYFKGHLVKVEMALVKGKKLFDKRQDQKRRTAERDMKRAMTRRR